MIAELERRFDNRGYSLWGFDRPTEHWLMPDLMLIASQNAFERWMFDTAVAEDQRAGETLRSWLRRVAPPERAALELQPGLSLESRFFEFGTLVFFDLAGRLDVPGVHYIGRMRDKPLEELLRN